MKLLETSYVSLINKQLNLKSTNEYQNYYLFFEFNTTKTIAKKKTLLRGALVFRMIFLYQKTSLVKLTFKLVDKTKQLCDLECTHTYNIVIVHIHI